MKYIQIKNWEKFQHYRDRNPPWVKLYRDLLDDYEYGCLQDASKLLLISFYLLACCTNNSIPADREWIKKRAMLKMKVDWRELEAVGFITISDDASNPLASCYQHAIPETETETETETESTYCPEPQNSSDSGPLVLSIPLIRKHGEFPIYQKDIDEWQETFPGVDIPQKLKEICQWNKDNKERRKTRNGIRRHISLWLAREQNRAKGEGSIGRKYLP